MTRFSFKNQKPRFGAIFEHFCPMGIFSKKSSSVTRNYTWAPNIMQSFRKKKTEEPIPRKLTEDGSADGRTELGQTDRQNLFYRTLPAKAVDPTTSLQQPLFRMLRCFLYSYKRENFKPEIKPMIQNLRNELYQLENKQAKGGKLLGNIRSWRAKNAPKLSSKYLKDSIR